MPERFCDDPELSHMNGGAGIGALHWCSHDHSACKFEPDSGRCYVCVFIVQDPMFRETWPTLKNLTKRIKPFIPIIAVTENRLLRSGYPSIIDRRGWCRLPSNPTTDWKRWRIRIACGNGPRPPGAPVPWFCCIGPPRWRTTGFRRLLKLDRFGEQYYFSDAGDGSDRAMWDY